MSAATFEVRRLRGNIRNGWTAKGNAILLVMRDSSNAISNDVCQHLRKYGPLLSERRKKDVVPSIAVGPFPISFFFFSTFQKCYQDKRGNNKICLRLHLCASSYESILSVDLLLARTLSLPTVKTQEKYAYFCF